ncbi:MAG: ABC transporter permease [Anaeroplasmataceae bacterium]|jgi:ABC-type spermidine/putrescine transport system, permease component I|nr:ABC transporter permease [Anaeroplasmataceae bacterium]
MNSFKKYSIPYILWIIIFTGIPLLLMILFAFSTIETFSVYNFDFSNYEFTFSNFAKLSELTFLKAFGRSILYAFIATVLCILIGYPIAYFISSSHFKHKYLILLVFIMPMWTNMLLRIQTINNLLSENSFLSNVFHISINLTNYKALKIILVMTIVYLPFMILPIYTVLEKIDKSYVEASNDLGANGIKSFFKITLPLSFKGVVSGIMMVFLPAAMGFTIPQIVTNGDPDYRMVGQLIERQFKSSHTFFNIGSLWSLIIIIFVLGSLYIISKIDEEGETLL